MDTDRIASLPDRQKESLRLYYHRLSVKEIAAVLDLKANTVDRYLTDAGRTLGAGRAAAAAALIEFEATHVKHRGRFSVGDPALLTIAPLVHAVQGEPIKRTSWSALFPLRRGEKRNDLTIYERLLPIPLIAAAIAIAIGAGAYAMSVISGHLVR